MGAKLLVGYRKIQRKQSADLMMPTPETSAFERALSPFLQLAIPKETVSTLVEFTVDPELHDRIELLASKSTEDELTDDERAEYQGYVRANKFIAMIQRQARRMAGNATQ